MRTATPEPERDIEVGSLIGVIQRNLSRIVLAAAVVGGLTYGGLLLVPSEYKSEAQIRIGSQGFGETGRAGGGSAESAALLVDREAIQSRVQELRSPDLAKKLAAELRLNERPEFNSVLEAHQFLPRLLRMVGMGGPRAGETEDERVLTAYQRALQVHHVKETRVITVAFTARDGELAADAANRLIEAYRTWLGQQGQVESSDLNARLVPEIEMRAKELAAAEAEVDRFRSTANLFKGAGRDQSGLAEQQLTELSTELVKARGQLSEVQARAKSARELIGRGASDAIPDVQKSPLIQGLIQQRVRAEREMAEAAVQLLPAHPRMKQLNATVLDVRRQVQREAATIVEGLEREVSAAKLREELASRSLEDAKARLGAKSSERVRVSELEDNVKAKRRELETLRERFEAGRSRGTTKAGPLEVQVIATARPSSRPSAPNRIAIAGLAGAATLVLGLVGALLKGLASGGAPVSTRSPGAMVLTPRGSGVEPSLPTLSVAGSQVETGGARAAVMTSISSVVARLTEQSGGKGGYRTLIVADGSPGDVREIAADVAAGLSSGGRQVVLIDWSPSGRGISAGLGLPTGPGVAELIKGTAQFDDVIHALPDGDVHVLPSGAGGAIDAEALDPDRLNLLLDALDEAYQDVVIAGRADEVRKLFVAIEGRVDAAVVIGGSEAGDAGGANELLGFEVTEIEVMRLRLASGRVSSRVAPMRGRLPKRATATSAGATGLAG